MSKKLKKTNAARILDGLGIDYDIKTYEVDESDLSAVHVAEVSGLDIKMIFKTLVRPPGVSFISTPMMSVIFTRKFFSSRASFPFSGLSTTSLKIPNSDVSAMHIALMFTSASLRTSSGFDRLPILFCKNIDNCLIFIFPT